MDRILSIIMTAMKKHQAYSSEDEEIIQYGLEILLMKIMMYAVFLTIALLTKSLLPAICFMLAYLPLRTFSGGYHQNTRIGCLVFSLIMFLGVVFSVKFISQCSTYFLIFAFIIFSVPVILKFAPMDTPDKPLNQAEQVVFHKRIIVLLLSEVVLIAVLWIFEFYILSFSMSLGLLADCLLLLLECLIRFAK